MSNPPTQDLSGRVVLITGANTGIGRATAEVLAKNGAHIIMACRSREKTEPVMHEIRTLCGHDRVEFIPLDLGSLASVRKCAETFLTRDLPLHILINNAGLAGHKGLTSDGFEMTFGVNHLGHFLLTMLLLDRIKQSAPARIVNVASRAHKRTNTFDFDILRQPYKGNPMSAYAVSKLANVLFSAELARRLEGTNITTYSLHPGVVASDVWRSVPWPIRPLIKRFMLTNEQGALTTLHCAMSPKAAHETGLYYDESKPKTPTTLAQDQSLARSLWDKSIEWAQLSPEELVV